MSRDVYPSLSGAMAAWRHLEVVSSNLANSTTTGFKAQRLSFSEAAAAASKGQPLAASYVAVEGTATDLSDGPVVQDGVPTHLALQGQGFFEADYEGQTVLLRPGAFSRDAEGFLVSPSGAKVRGTGGPVQISPEVKNLVVTEDGTLVADGDELDKLSLVTADQVRPVGGGRFEATGPTRPATGMTVIQGALEGSNADPIQGMTELIQASRYFEAYQKAMQTSDQLDGRLNETARS